MNHTFLHYRGGTNWDDKCNEYHRNKTTILNEFFNKILS